MTVIKDRGLFAARKPEISYPWKQAMEMGMVFAKIFTERSYIRGRGDKNIFADLVGKNFMKKISDKDYNEFMEYKQAKAHGRILTPSALRLICEANDNNPEKIGAYILDSLHRIKKEVYYG